MYLLCRSVIFILYFIFFKRKKSCKARKEQAPFIFQDFTMHVYFRQFWTDPRLSFEKRPGLEKLFVGAEYINTIWTPDTFFVNEKTAFFHNATTENQFLRILNTGEILRSIRWVNDKTRIKTRGKFTANKVIKIL